MEFLAQLDHQLLLFANKTVSNKAFDLIFPWLTDLHKQTLTLVLVLIIWAFLIYRKRKFFFIGLALILVVAFDDFLGGQLKNLFNRPRPDVAGFDVILRSPHFGGPSFPSNHAMNMFCIASFLSWHSKKVGAWFYFLACLIAFSRVYCGVHFPTDVISGGFLGVTVGHWGAITFHHLFGRFYAK